ncbi:uncharacterized protein Z519_01798 [Cladophialophora bantiana CBS 173.52]|uniref:Uncharacterized protein n=1 Tax=Cladophialophora bantiana (strain ATCC 10958 / CBS 173.52 / CDC B-1940 / NIH 8579) TaxID=1442370 RepID=A0A0D2IN41_CLAB1|nr:uncharacterized protein Z519_01798 [Cladophialophora bantiana CBS 173.52]KIW98214.1 hypothetical protein Z519_01798 [Cladophialophora bantiana CBS 173.52]
MVVAFIQANPYRDASKLVQRLKHKQETSEEFILPEQLTKDFEDSLSLGCTAVQSLYDHDVRRFGETYARGDAIAREQMKDILINLQQAVISHLREVFMDEATLNLHMLKETSDDCRVNATVCLGQLYQRMSTATAAMKQISRPYVDDPDKVQLPGSLAYSSSRSTHSSFGGRPYDDRSATSYTTYSSRTAVGYDHKPSGALPPQRRTSMNSTFSYTSEPPKSRTPGEDNVPALPFPMQRQTSQGSVEATPNGSGLFQQLEDSAPPTNAAPPPYRQNLSRPVYTSDEKGQKFPKESSFYQSPVADQHSHVPQNTSFQHSPRIEGDIKASVPGLPVQVHELDHSQSFETHRTPEQELTAQNTSTNVPSNQRPAIPLNPDYSTLEYVETLDSRSRPPVARAPDNQYQSFWQQLPSPLQQQVQQSMWNGYQNQQMLHGQPITNSPVSRPQTSNIRPESIPAAVDPLPQQKVPTIPSVPRPLSIRSTGSNGSRLGSFTIRKGLPPGIADAIHKPAPSALETQFNSLPRYVKPKALDLADNEQIANLNSPTSLTGQPIDNMSDSITVKSTSESASLESTMRLASASPQLQIARSQLNLPSESNLAGFCKGAVRQQLGGRKKGFSLEHRKGPKGQEYFWRCTKCNFEGPALVSKALPSGGRGSVKTEKTYDNKVRYSEGGIKYRWNFLAKCHVSKKLMIGDAMNNGDVFACYFCCVEGAAKGWIEDGVSSQLARLGGFGEKKATMANVTPTFTGLQAFLTHLETHRLPDRIPGLIASNEMYCIVGRVAHEQEEFDLNLPPLGA